MEVFTPANTERKGNQGSVSAVARAPAPFWICDMACDCNSESWKAMVPVCALLVSHAIPVSSADWSS